MSAKPYAVLFLALALALIDLTGYAQKVSSKPQTWEYKTAYSRSDGFAWEKTLNELGGQGWELVATSSPADEAGVTYVFKRAK